MTDDDLRAHDVEAVTNLANHIREGVTEYLRQASEDGDAQDRMSAVVGSAISLVVIEMGQRGDPLLPSIVVTNCGGSPFFRAH